MSECAELIENTAQRPDISTGQTICQMSIHTVCVTQLINGKPEGFLRKHIVFTLLSGREINPKLQTQLSGNVPITFL